MTISDKQYSSLEGIGYDTSLHECTRLIWSKPFIRLRLARILKLIIANVSRNYLGEGLLHSGVVAFLHGRATKVPVRLAALDNERPPRQRSASPLASVLSSSNTANVKHCPSPK